MKKARVRRSLRYELAIDQWHNPSLGFDFGSPRTGSADPLRGFYSKITNPAGGSVSSTARPLRAAMPTVWPICDGSVE